MPSSLVGSLVCPLEASATVAPTIVAPTIVAPATDAPASVPRSPALATAADPWIVLAVLAVLAFGFMATVLKFALIQSTAPSVDPPVEKTNCPACGARTPVEDSSCEYCGESLPGVAPGDPATATAGETGTNAEGT